MTDDRNPVPDRYRFPEHVDLRGMVRDPMTIWRWTDSCGDEMRVNIDSGVNAVVVRTVHSKIVIVRLEGVRELHRKLGEWIDAREDYIIEKTTAFVLDGDSPLIADPDLLLLADRLQKQYQFRDPVVWDKVLDLLVERGLELP